MHRDNGVLSVMCVKLVNKLFGVHLFAVFLSKIAFLINGLNPQIGSVIFCEYLPSFFAQLDCPRQGISFKISRDSRRTVPAL